MSSHGSSESNAAYYAAHREERAAYAKARRTDPERHAELLAHESVYRATHKEKIAANAAVYYASHREEQAAIGAVYRAAHREERAAKGLIYYASHREERAAYYASHRETARINNAARHAARQAAKAKAELQSGRFTSLYSGKPQISLRHKLEAMSLQTTSPYEADIARQKLEVLYG